MTRQDDDVIIEVAILLMHDSVFAEMYGYTHELMHQYAAQILVIWLLLIFL